MNDELISIAHLLLQELEANQQAIEEAPYLPDANLWEGIYQDNQAAIEKGKEILSRYPI